MLYHAIQNISLLKLLIIEQNAAADSYSPHTILAPPAIDPIFSSNLDQHNYESANIYIFPPVLPGEYQQAGPSSGASSEFRSNSARGSDPLPLQPHS